MVVTVTDENQRMQD